VSQIATVFKLNRKGFNPRRSVSVLVMLVPLVVLGLLDQEKYYLSVAFGALFVGLSDPGGEYGYRVPRMAAVAVVGALLTALGSPSVAVPGGGWPWPPWWSPCWPGWR
jgi:hypothetical protein